VHGDPSLKQEKARESLLEPPPAFTLDCAKKNGSDNPWELLAPFAVTLIKPENRVKLGQGDYLPLPCVVSFLIMVIVLA
jgi:hypothetical protein